MAKPKLTEADHLATAHLTINKAAEVLGVSFGAVKRLRERLEVEIRDERYLDRDQQADWEKTMWMTYTGAANALGVSRGYIQRLRERLDPEWMDRAAIYNQRRGKRLRKPEETSTPRFQYEVPTEEPTPTPVAQNRCHEAGCPNFAIHPLHRGYCRFHYLRMGKR
jgi:hypothetical protein